MQTVSKSLSFWFTFVVVVFLFVLCYPGKVHGQLKGLEGLRDSSLTIPEILQYNPGLMTYFPITEIQADYMNGIAQHLVKNKNGLFLLVDGTGRVYKIEWGNNVPKLVRQDSTSFFGYNFGFYPFSYRDTVYSFGGYGYWRYNGHLRVFIPQKGEWELENLNRELPFHRVVHTATPKWLDITRGQLWIGVSIASTEGVQKNAADYKSVTDSVYVLDLNKKTWKTLGGLSSNVKSIATELGSRNLGTSPWGQVIFDQSKATIYLLDYIKNEIRILNSGDTKTITRLLQTESILYFRDSTFFVGLPSRLLDSVKLSKDKFILTEDRVYVPSGITGFISNTISPSFGAVLGGVAGVISIGGWLLYYLASKRRDRGNARTEGNGVAINLFDEKEVELLELIISNSSKGQSTSIEALNRKLGVAQKNLEIQKKQRSDALISINRKWRYKNSSKDLLVVKKRVEQDKRSFEYFIEFENLAKLQEILTERSHQPLSN